VPVELRRGVTVKGRVLGPDGKPVAKSRMACLWHLPGEYHHTSQQLMEIREGTFELPGCDPEKAWPAFFMDGYPEWNRRERRWDGGSRLTHGPRIGHPEMELPVPQIRIPVVGTLRKPRLCFFSGRFLKRLRPSRNGLALG
jgi:hypothetical protein